MWRVETADAEAAPPQQLILSVWKSVQIVVAQISTNLYNTYRLYGLFSILVPLVERCPV
jgi:hypothetical protein